MSEPLSRRDFLKLAAVGVGVIPTLGSKGRLLNEFLKTTVDRKESTVIDGVEVYGTDNPFKTEQEVNDLYKNFDDKFDSLVTPELKGKSLWEQRERLLPRNERLLEIVVTQSAYKDFVPEDNTNGVDFVGFMHQHVDLLNRVIENSEMPNLPKAKLKRVIIVDDAYGNPFRHSKDIDASRFVDSSFDKITSRGSYIWLFQTDDSKNLVLKKRQKYVFPQKADSLNGKRGMVDCGEIHEWMHLLYNIPDDYILNVDAGNLKQFLRPLTFVDPYINPFLLYIIKQNQEKGIRGYYSDPKGLGMETDIENESAIYLIRPEKVKISCESVSEIQITKARFVPGKDKPSYYLPKTFPDLPDQTSVSNHLDLANEFFSHQPIGFETRTIELVPTVFQIKVMKDSKEKKLFLPTPVFLMTKLAGIENAEYKIHFSKDATEKIESLNLQLVPERNLNQLLKELGEQGEVEYARMKIEGTPFLSIWTTVSK